MGLIQLLADTAVASGLASILGVEAPVAAELLAELKPSLPGIKRVLEKHGLNEVCGIDLGEFLGAFEKDLQEPE